MCPLYSIYKHYSIFPSTRTLIANHTRLQLCIFGGGHSLAYVLDNNVYYLPENRSEAIQITNDGIPGVFYNGHTDWVYEGTVLSFRNKTLVQNGHIFRFDIYLIYFVP